MVAQILPTRFEPRRSRHLQPLRTNPLRGFGLPLQPLRRSFVTASPARVEKNLFLDGMKTTDQVPSGKQRGTPEPKFRLELNRQNHRVVITTSVDKRGYTSYVFAYYLGGKRQQVRRASLADIKLEANLALTKLAQNEPDVLSLTSTDRLIYLRACGLLANSVIPLDVAVGDYVSAVNRLNGLGTISTSAGVRNSRLRRSALGRLRGGLAKLSRK